MKKIKVLHLLQSDTFSGAENVVCQIFNLFKTDENVEIIYCSKDGPISEALYEKGISFFPIEEFNVSAVRKVILEWKPDIIHAHDANASIHAVMAAPRSVKVISHIHGNHENMRRPTLKSLLYLLFSFRFEQIFWVSNSSLNGYCFRKLVSSKSEVLMNVIDGKQVELKAMSDKHKYHFDGIVLGRLNSIKDPLRAIKIISEVKQIIPDIEFAFVGDGDLFSKCENEIKNYKLENNVSLLGYKKNPLGILSNSRFMLMTSVYEGTPMCALEAMALGKPIISTPIDGLIDIIEYGKTGYYSNSDDDLVGYICELMIDERKLVSFSNSTKERFSTLMDLNDYKEKIEDTYFRVVK